MSDILEHVYAIQNLKAQYCATIDSATRDAQAASVRFAALFTPDVVGDYGFEPMVGAVVMAEFLCTAIGLSSDWMIHMIHTPMIVVDGNRATGDWTVLAHMKRTEGGAIDLVLGRYADEFRLTPDGWRISRVTFSRLV